MLKVGGGEQAHRKDVPEDEMQSEKPQTLKAAHQGTLRRSERHVKRTHCTQGSKDIHPRLSLLGY